MYFLDFSAMGTSLWQLCLYNAAGLCTRWRI
nr:unnamed protein product [Callosobruchus chinensis]